MLPEEREKELRESVETARREYVEATKLYDAWLVQAHSYNHGTPEMLAALDRATSLAPRLSASLRDYHTAVSELANFYRSQQ